MAFSARAALDQLAVISAAAMKIAGRQAPPSLHNLLSPHRLIALKRHDRREAERPEAAKVRESSLSPPPPSSPL